MTKLLQIKQEYDIPFVPSSDERLRIMLKFADPKLNEFSVDLGSGDGKVVIAMAKRGTVAYGLEIDRRRAQLAALNIEKENLLNRAFIFNVDFWRVDLSAFDIITLYGISSIMEKLEEKLMSELKPGARVVSNLFTFPNWKPARKEGDVYLYIR